MSPPPPRQPSLCSPVLPSFTLRAPSVTLRLYTRQESAQTPGNARGRRNDPAGAGRTGLGLRRSPSNGEGEGGGCVEVAHEFPGVVRVRDSKVVQGPVLVIGSVAWTEFIGAVGTARFRPVSCLRAPRQGRCASPSAMALRATLDPERSSTGKKRAGGPERRGPNRWQPLTPAPSHRRRGRMSRSGHAGSAKRLPASGGGGHPPPAGGGRGHGRGPRAGATHQLPVAAASTAGGRRS
ncbi:DUF397 domain-containing protein [Streptomyces sp. NPDC046727]|uniref:DUF397 domain-containing protein n=1 Tax=Streptomyces sp. NPDC046727 TaxID=3155373 RepID=UPI003402A9CD